jgi:type II secretory pathway component PulM
MPGGLTAALADLGPGPRRLEQRGRHQPGRAAASHDAVHRLVRLSARSMSIKIINVKKYGNPVNVKILSVHG